MTGTCTHTWDSYLVGSQMTRDLTVYATTRDVVRAVYRKIEPKARRAAKYRVDRHRVIMAALHAIRHDQYIKDRFRL